MVDMDLGVTELFTIRSAGLRPRSIAERSRINASLTHSLTNPALYILGLQHGQGDDFKQCGIFQKVPASCTSFLGAQCEVMGHFSD